MIKLPEAEKGSAFSEAMTPMIDVIFVLVAFMMLMINVPLSTMEVELPKAHINASTTASDVPVFNIALLHEDTQWYLNKDAFADLTALKAKLKDVQAQNAQLSIVIHSDKLVPMERVVSLFAALQELGLNVSHLALEQ